ncbi:uncharacterized protein LOC6560994 [Drosophila grimshawi]|uniref:GH21345 n=2 Tax=Drosophila grimshawi TaxID=7222 RepID=B4J8K6_DROGR|nr:uncharacterized protein LOC6560994 [Drosophila grimshawi]EDW01273.1 GH21345 [Drosophila grimshawi]
MWEQLNKYRNHFLQHEIKDVLTPSSINSLQNKEWQSFMEKRNRCKSFPQHCTKSSTYFEDRAQLAYGWFALPKLMREMDSDDNLTHWRAIYSLSEFLLNPLNAQRAILEMEIVRKLKNAFMRLCLKFHKEEHEEMKIYLKIFNIISRNLNGAEQIANRKCLMIEFYKIAGSKESEKQDLAAEILRNLTGQPKVLGIVIKDEENLGYIANIFKQDPCRPYYPADLWHHLCHMLELAPQLGIDLGFFELLHSRIENRLPLFWEMNSKAFALLLRCEEGQRRFDKLDVIQLIYEVFEEVYVDKSKKLPGQFVENYEYLILILMDGLHSKRALWRIREFTMLTCHVARRMASKRTTNPRIQLYGLKTLRNMGTMPCVRRYIIGNWLTEICEMKCLDAEAECARDALLDWLRRDIADSSS